MLDALRNMTFGKGSQAQDEIAELRALLAASRDERAAMGTMLATVITRTVRMAPLSKSLEQATEMATSVAAKLDDVAERPNPLDVRTKDLPAIDRRILALKEAVRRAEQTTQKVTGPDSDLLKHTEAVQHLSGQLLATQTVFDAINKERPALE